MPAHDAAEADHLRSFANGERHTGLKRVVDWMGMKHQAQENKRFDTWLHHTGPLVKRYANMVLDAVVADDGGLSLRWLSDHQMRTVGVAR